ncbi:MAG: ATP-binding protein [Myxococcaceae bacterium]
MLEEELGKGLSAVAAAAASQLAADRLLSVEPDDDVNETRTYRNLMRLLGEVKASTGARRIFAFDKQGRVRLDAGGGLPVGAEVPELARDRLELARVFAGERVASQVLFVGSDGSPYKTGYAPVMLDGLVVAAVGVEGSAEFFGPLRTLFRGYLILVAIASAVLVAIAFLSARGVAAPLHRLLESAVRIGRGDLETKISTERVRELGALATELETMRGALESRDRQLKMMLAGVAHEVRNPIGGIELFAGLLAEELGPTEHVKKIQREIDYLKRIVEDFLSFARDQKTAPVPTEMAPLLENVKELLGGPIEISAEPAQVRLDVSLITAAVVNLTKNAVQASPPGGVVKLQGALREGRYEVRVEDAGAGIPAELQERIFEPFFTTREKGTGLGLPLARKIAQAHRGSLTVSSAPGRTVFLLELPR